MAEERKSVGRRDFLRLAGLGAGATLAAPAVAGKAKPTGGQRVSDPAGRPNRPWWVKTVDTPTTEIDWDMMERFNEREGSIRGPGYVKYHGEEKAERLNKASAENEARRIKEGVPGYSLKDYAMWDATMFDLRADRSYLGPQTAPTPEERGVPKWSGSEDEAAKIVRAAFRHFGAAHVGFVELNDKTKKLIYSHDPDGKQIVFEDVDEAYETDEKRIIPNKAKWVIVYTVQMSNETLKRAPTVIGAQTTLLSYGRGAHIQNMAQEFLRELGYQGLGEAQINGIGVAPAFGVLAGLGEMGRMNRMITPEYGPMVRVFKMITDLPVATDKPIDAGIVEFCKRCKKCAEACPSGAISYEDEPFWETRGGWNNPGHKAWFEDSVKCQEYQKLEAGTNCGLCFSTCTFAKENKAWIHDWVKAGAATMPVLDGFFRSMDDAFGYGTEKDQEDWWNLDLPEYGIDTLKTVEEA